MAWSFHLVAPETVAYLAQIDGMWLIHFQERSVACNAPTPKASPSRRTRILSRLGKERANKAWEHPHDTDVRITKMKDGRTHMAHKAEHTVDLDTQALVALQVCGADEGDTGSLLWSLVQADRSLKEVGVDEQIRLSEVVADRGYHSNATMKMLRTAEIRSYVAEPDRGRRNWKKDAPAREAVYANRRRIRGERGKRLQRLRAEHVERSFAHTYETGGMRRTHLRGHTNIYKRLCIHGGAFNLGLVMRKLTGKGTPKGLNGLASIFSTFADRANGILGRIFGYWRLLSCPFQDQFYKWECLA